MSDANRTITRIVPEVTPGTTPATPAFRTLRTTGSGISYSPQTVTSGELPGSNRRIKDLRLVGYEAGGAVPFELSWDDGFFELMQGAFFGTWSNKLVREGTSQITTVETTGDTFATTAVSPAWANGMLVRATGFTNAGNNALHRADSGSTATSLAVDSNLVNETAPASARLKLVGIRCAVGDCASATAGNTLTISASTGSWSTYGLVPGEWVKMSGWTGAAAANNGFARIAAVTSATVLTFDVVPTGFVTNSGTGMTVSLWLGDYLRDGVVDRSYSVEREFPDLATPLYEYSRGHRVNASVSVSSRSVATGEFSFFGEEADAFSASRFAGATTVEAGDADVMDASNNVPQFFEGGVALPDDNEVLSFSLNIDNQLRRLPAVGTRGSVGVKAGRALITAEVETYFGSAEMANKVRNNTASQFMARFQDDNGTRGFLFDLPRTKYTGGGDPSVSGPDTDRTVSLPLQALGDETQHAIHFQRFEEYV
jgi:hypothetical protein